MDLLHTFGDEPSSPGGASWASFVAGVNLVSDCVGEFIFALCKCRKARVRGTGFPAGLVVPTGEHVVVWCVPHVFSTGWCWVDADCYDA
jgi:hypothetical protein